MKATALTFARLPKTYSGLVALRMPRPIHDTVAYDNAAMAASKRACGEPRSSFQGTAPEFSASSNQSCLLRNLTL